MRSITRCLAIVALVATMNGAAYGADPWTKSDVALEATYAALLVIDWGQTRNIAAHPDKWREYNPVLGKHPHRDTVDLICAGSLIGHAVVTHFLPAEWRPYWQWVTVAAEGSAVGWNFNAGINVDF